MPSVTLTSWSCCRCGVSSPSELHSSCWYCFKSIGIVWIALTAGTTSLSGFHSSPFCAANLANWSAMLFFFFFFIWIFDDVRTHFNDGEWGHFTRRTETFQKISNMYGYLFVHITLHEFSVNSKTWGEGGKMLRSSAQGVDPPVCRVLDVAGKMLRSSAQGVDPPVCRTPGCYCYICKRQLCGFPQCATSWMTYARDSFVDSPSGAFCPLEGGAQTHWHQSYSSTWLQRALDTKSSCRMRWQKAESCSRCPTAKCCLDPDSNQVCYSHNAEN